MNNKCFLVIFLIASLFSTKIAAQSTIMHIHTKNGNVIQYDIADVDSITFQEFNYTPAFKNTNITSGSWDNIALCKNRLFATHMISGTVEYIDGNWVTLNTGFSGANNYPIIGENSGSILIASSDGVYAQSPNDGNNFHVALNGKGDLAGALGGSSKYYFSTGGTNGNGIFRFTGYWFADTNQSLGCWYSIEALDDDNVFFGAGASHVSANYGVVRWDGPQQKIMTTNLTSGVYTLTKFNDKMYAQGQDGVYVWDGSSFVKIHSTGGMLRVAGNNLYCFNSAGVLKFDVASSTFNVWASKDKGYFTEIEEYDGWIYLFGEKVIGYNRASDTWKDIASDGSYITKAFISPVGLFICGNNNNKGIQKMVPNY